MSIFSIGLSGLNTAQAALKTTSNNISNVYTPGYNRELTLVSEQRVGGGAMVTDVQRQFDYFVASQLNSASSASHALESYHTQVSQIDNLLADLDGGLAPMLENFFSALEDLASAPSDPAARQGVIGTANTLAAQIHSFDGYLGDLQDGIDSRIESEVIQINNTATQIAQLNREITLARAKNGQAPNALLNQRDHLVAELNKHIDVRLHIQDGGVYNLTIGNGKPLVAGTEAYGLAAMASEADPTQTVVGYQDSAGNEVRLDEGVFQGGSLGGLLAFRRETLEETRSAVGQLAASLALAVNEQHRMGTDLNGDAGGDFFAIGAPQVYAHADNPPGGAAVTAAFADYRELSGSDYDIAVSDAALGEFTITRRDGGGSSTATLDAAGQLHFDGLTLTVDDRTLLATGDRFQLQPTRLVAGGMKNLIQDTGRIAAGLSGASGDNENALALQNLQNAPLVGGKATLNQAYAALVGEVGNRANVVQVNLQAQESLTEQLTLVQQSESGVNLDEEAANLIRYQQYYQANARVIDVGSTLLDTILNLRR